MALLFCNIIAVALVVVDGVAIDGGVSAVLILSQDAELILPQLFCLECVPAPAVKTVCCPWGKFTPLTGPPTFMIAVCEGGGQS